MDIGLPAIRVCGYHGASTQVPSKYIPGIECNLAFREYAIGFKYNLVCTCKLTHRYVLSESSLHSDST